jgi:hypothetical protein
MQVVMRSSSVRLWASSSAPHLYRQLILNFAINIRQSDSCAFDTT